MIWVSLRHRGSCGRSHYDTIPIPSYTLSFAARAMIYVVVEEVIPEAQAGKHSNIGAALGFALMMVLGVALR